MRVGTLAHMATRDATSSPLQVVTPGQSLADADPYETLVPPGEYLVGFLRDEDKYRYYGRWCWRCSWQILDEGPSTDLVVYGWFNIPPSDAPITRSHALWQAYVVATRGLTPPKDLAEHRPRWFLGDCQFRAKVRTVDKDSNRVKRPYEASYSRVDFLIERVEGLPPCLQRRGSG